MASVTQQTWQLGKSKGMTGSEIRANWKSLYSQVWHENMEGYQSGISKIYNEIEATISHYTKSQMTYNAEMVSLDNIKKIVNQAVVQAGPEKAFKAFSKIYDNGAGEYLQRIMSAIYDKEMAQWASGMSAYISILNSQIRDKMSEYTGHEIRSDDDSIQNPFGEDTIQPDNYDPVKVDPQKLKDLLL